MLFEIFYNDWDELRIWLDENLPQAKWSHSWCDYEDSVGKWIDVILIDFYNVTDDDLILLKLSNSHILRNLVQKDGPEYLPSDCSETE